MILTFQLPPNEVAQSTSEVDFLSSYLNQTTSEENIRTRHTRIRASYTQILCFFPSLPSPPWPSSQNQPSGEGFRKIIPSSTTLCLTGE